MASSHYCSKSRCCRPVAQIKKILGSKIKVIFLQNPYLDLSCFDVVIAPKHDGLKGKNLIETHERPSTM
ncbi:MAG: mitochondrial fission ELM1 family protein [Holosporaceae bacterium]|nr:MAG: mitochondrial fission ELM1 family protein [Holosporaceae bacterium]